MSTTLDHMHANQLRTELVPANDMKPFPSCDRHIVMAEAAPSKPHCMVTRQHTDSKDALS